MKCEHCGNDIGVRSESSELSLLRSELAEAVKERDTFKAAWLETGVRSAVMEATPSKLVPVDLTTDMLLSLVASTHLIRLSHGRGSSRDHLEKLHRNMWSDVLAAAPASLSSAITALPTEPTWQMKEAGGEAYLQCRELDGQRTGVTAMHIAEAIYKAMVGVHAPESKP